MTYISSALRLVEAGHGCVESVAEDYLKCRKLSLLKMIWLIHCKFIGRYKQFTG